MKAVLIRHAETTGQAPDAPLTQKGAEQAAALAPVLARLGAGPLFSSPYRRAQDTLAPYAAQSGQGVTCLDDLREVLLSAHDLPDDRDHLRRWFFDSTYAAPGGETQTQVFLRVARALKVIEASEGPLPTFVTHGGVTSMLFGRADPSFGEDDRNGLGNPDLFEVEIVDRRVVSFQRLAL